jgi:peptidoglycan hydrolase-like protein with peptidoglycan-binding domain
MGTRSSADQHQVIGGARAAENAELPKVERFVHGAVDLASGGILTNEVARPLMAAARAERLAELGLEANPAALDAPSYRLTPQAPYQAAPEAWLDAFDGSYSAGPGVDRIWWRMPPTFPTEFMAGCNFSVRNLAPGPAVFSLTFEAWPFQGATGVVVVDIGAHRTEFEIGVPASQTVDIGFDHDGADPLTIMVFFRPGLIDFVFRSMSLGSTNMSGAISPWAVVKSGSNGHPIKTLQHLLRARGQNVAVDGEFGPATEAAVKTFQANHGLTADGVVGPLTWAALVVQVKKGSQGDAVRGVQEEFQFRNLSGDPNIGPQIDGIFGPVTDAAVRDFDAVQRLRAIRRPDEEGEHRSKGGLLIPATAATVSKRGQWATVVAVGPNVRNVEPEDEVLLLPDAGIEVEIRGEEYLLVREREIHAVASERGDPRTGLYL